MSKPVPITPVAPDDSASLRRREVPADDDMFPECLASDAARQLFHELKEQNAGLVRIQQELELSRKRYFELYEQAPVGYCTISPEAVIREINLTAAILLGREKNDLLGCDFHHFIHPDDLDVFTCLGKQRDEDSIVPQSCEIRLLCGEECSPFWVLLQAGPAGCGEYRITLTDIHERKMTEIKLQESEERFRKLVMVAKVGVIQQERNGTITTWNETAERVFGLSADQAIGLNATTYDWSVYHEDGSPFPGSEHPSMQTFATGKPCLNVVMKVVRASGEFTWISINTGPLFRHGESTPYAVVITFSDISERKQAEAVLQARLRISDYAYDHPLDDLLTKIIDETEALTDSRIGFFHFVESDQVNLSLQTWSSNTLKNACSAEGKGQHYPLERAGVWADCIRQQKPLIHNDYLSLPDRRGLPEGHAEVQREMVVPIFRANRIVAVMGVGNKPTDYRARDLSLVQHLANLAWDVVNRKQMEESLLVKSQQLEELNQSLEQRIGRAIQDLRDKDELLIQQGRLAAMGEMINNIAHQWRQPLNNIGLIAQNLQFTFKAGGLSTTVMNRDIANIMQLLQQMSGTIDDFRNFFSNNKIVQTFQVNEAIRRSLNFMLPALKNGNINVQCVEDCELQAVGYPGEYTQAVLNILTNAKDVLLERAVAEPRIDIRIFSDNGRSVVVIADNGGGMAEEVLPRIFDPYFTTRMNGEGTGIGLFMSKIIIERNMGGHLTARNTDNGAEFRIEL